MRILLGGAGGAPTNNVSRSLRLGGSGDTLIGMNAAPAELLLADVDERHLVPPAVAPDYPERLLELLERSSPDLIHVQNDVEVRAISRMRNEIEAAGVKHYLPAAETVENCVDKFRSYEIWRRAGVPVAETIPIGDEGDLRDAFDRFSGRLWLRAREGGGGFGALPVDGPDQYEFARGWIERFRGWGSFTASERLSPDSVTWLSLWFEGDLVVGQTRKRILWHFANRTLSGVTGVTGVARTWSSEPITEAALAAVQNIDPRPHGIFAVDLTIDDAGSPRVTEINIGRFFTTVLFFAEAGLNLPQIYRDIALEGRLPDLKQKLDPLPDDLVWIRGMDVEPVLARLGDVEGLEDA